MHTKACTEIENGRSVGERQVQRLDLGGASLKRCLRTTGHPKVDRGEVVGVVLCDRGHAAGFESL